MNTLKLFLIISINIFLTACLGGGSDTPRVPGAPTSLKVIAGASAGTTASVSFTAPASTGGSPITGYTVTTSPDNIIATGTDSPISITGLTPGTNYTFSVTAHNNVARSTAASVQNIYTYNIVETFHEPMTQPNDSIFTGTFTYDSVSQTVTNLAGTLTESMTMGTPMTTVALGNQLSAVTDATLGGQLVTTFALNTPDTFDAGGFAPGGSVYFGFTASTPNNHNAYAMIFVNTDDPTTVLTTAQLNKLAYADCTAGGMMMTSCMTGTTVAGYGTLGTMNGYPTSQVITKQ
jgi:hypothetical protein